jgi:hypothetical protein
MTKIGVLVVANVNIQSSVQCIAHKQKKRGEKSMFGSDRPMADLRINEYAELICFKLVLYNRSFKANIPISLFLT